MTANAATTRVRYLPVEGATQIFTPQFCAYLAAVHDDFTPRVHALRRQRDAVLRRAVEQGILPGPPPPSAATTGDWKVPPVPEDLRRPGIEISGPCSITSMFINALNPGPEGERAEGDLDDDEDSSGHRLVDTVRAALNRLAAVNRELAFTDTERGRDYRIAPGELPFFMHRERGLHLDEPDVTVDGRAVPAAILGTAMTLFFAGRAQAGRGQGIYFYLPKVESAEEVAWYRDFFDTSRRHLPFLADATIRAIPLVESLPAVYLMEEMLYALGPYAAGLNAARWDLKASIFEFVMADPASVWPDRFGVDIKTTPFLANIFRRLVAICLKRGAVPIGGMATALPSNDPEVNRVAGESIRADKEWEAQQGFIRAWVAHIFHMKTAGIPSRSSSARAGSRRWPCPIPTAILSRSRCPRAPSPSRGRAATRAWSSSTSKGGWEVGARRASTAWRASRACIPRSWKTSPPAACRWPRSLSASGTIPRTRPNRRRSMTSRSSSASSRRKWRTSFASRRPRMPRRRRATARR